MLPRIVNARVLVGWRLALTFTDGISGVVDLNRVVHSRDGLFTALRDPTVFAQVAVDREAGTVVWPNGLDLDPDVLYAAAQGGAEALSEFA